MKKVTKKKLLLAKIEDIVSIPLGYAQFTGTHAHEVNREQITLPQKSLKSPIRILHMSDFHASGVVPYKFLDRAVELGISCKPDIICLTGDYVTHFIPEPLTAYRDILAKLPAAAPTFASFGNHDMCYASQNGKQYIDSIQVGKLLEDSGITVLVNQEAQITVKTQPLRIVGLADIYSKMMNPGKALPKQGSITEDPIILLSHNPDTKMYLKKYEWDVMLCGHTHGGQCNLPFIGPLLAPVMDKRFLEGLHFWQDRWIHVTRGVGNVHGIRINCRPQVSVIEIIK